MKRYKNWIIALVLSATAGAVALQNGLAPSLSESTETASILSTDTPTTTPTYEPCGYMWAYQDVPELTIKIEPAVHTLNPEAKIRTQAFGENCVYADGRATFLAMETDVYIHTIVDDLTNEEALGNWMAQTLPLIVQISEDEFPGGYGKVEFWFENSSGESLYIRPKISRFLEAEVRDKAGAELFRLLNENP
jgi:hypothetical protein